MFKYSIFSSLGAIVFTLVLSSKVFSQSESIVISEDKYFVDNHNKIILCTQKVSALPDLHGSEKVEIQLDKVYKFINTPSTLKYSESYDLESEADGNDKYKLFFTQFPVFSINTNGEIVDDPKVGGYLTFSDSTGVKLRSDIGVELRGSFSQTLPKKSYDLEFWEDESGENTIDAKFGNLRSDDDWILDALYNEPLRINSYTSHKLWLDIHTLYYSKSAPKAKAGVDVSYAELFLNGKYNGIYMLSEQVDRKQLDLKKTSDTSVQGELIKGDNWGDAVIFKGVKPFDNNSEIWDGFEMKYPDEFISWNNIHDFVDFVVNSSDDEFKENIFHKFDISSAVDYFIYMNAIGAGDNWGKNIFIGKYKAGEPYFYIPWDLDGTYGTLWDGSRLTDATFILKNGLYERLLKINPDLFVERLRERWTELRSTSYSEEALLGKLNESYYELKNNNVYEREMLVWKDYKYSVSDSTFMTSWVKERLIFLDGYFAQIEGSGTAIKNSEGLNLIYPVPATDYINIDYTGTSGTGFSIINSQGLIQKSGNLDFGKNLISTATLENGIYFIVIGNSVQKISILK